MRNIAIIKVLILLLLSFSVSVAAATEIAVIVNNENSNQIDAALVKKIYLGNSTRWNSGGSIVVLDLSDRNPATGTFYSKVCYKSAEEMRNVWATNVFTGKASTPKEFQRDQDVKNAVNANRNAIGYINASALDSSVKEVLRIR